MAISLVQSKFDLAFSVNHSTFIPDSIASAGNLLLMNCAWINNVNVSSVVDTAGNTFTKVPGAASGGSNGYRSDIWYQENSLAGLPGYTVTVTMSGTALRLRSWFSEWSGVRLSGSLDSAGNISGPASPVSPVITPSVANQLLIATISSNDNAITGRNAPWTVLPSDGGGESNETDYYINAPLSSQQVVYQPTTSEDFGSSVASFFAPATGPSNAVKSGMFLVLPEEERQRRIEWKNNWLGDR